MSDWLQCRLSTIQAELKMRNIPSTKQESKIELAAKLDAQGFRHSSGRQPLNLLHLPAEIRRNIWKLVQPKLIPITSCDCGAIFRPSCDCRLCSRAKAHGYYRENDDCLFRKLKESLWLRLVNRQVHEEISALPRWQLFMVSPRTARKALERP